MANCAAEDILGTISVNDVCSWYRRLAANIGARRVNGHNPLASTFLSEYLAPQSRTGPVTFAAPPYLRDHSLIQSALLHHRRVYLTQEEMRTGGSGRRWAGIAPRWRDPARYGWDRRSQLTMYYEALIQVPLAWQVGGGNDGERDILYALGLGFQLRTDVTCRVTSRSDGLDVMFDAFTARINDRYDFNPREHITVPNPDHRSTAADAVCPGKDRIRVYHRNAQRMERAHRAAPYDLESDPWAVTDTRVSGPGTVTV